MLKILVHDLFLLSDDEFRELGGYCLSAGGAFTAHTYNLPGTLAFTLFFIIHSTWDNHRSNIVNINHRLTIYHKVS